MSQVKSDVLGLEFTADVKVKRELKSFKVDAKSETIVVLYNEVKYYLDGADEVVMFSEDKSYMANYAEWFGSAEGIAIRTSIEGKLAQDDPSV